MTDPGSQTEVLSSPGHDRPPNRALASLVAFVRRSPRLLISLGLAALLVAGLVQTVRNGGPEEQLANAYASAFKARDCLRFADLYHYDPPVRPQRRAKVDVCERSGPDMELTGFDVTDVATDPPDQVLPPGSDQVAVVDYAAVFDVPGRSVPVDGVLVMARYDGAWALVSLG